jgi:hypothetical protein
MIVGATVLDRFKAENYQSTHRDIMISISDTDDVWPDLYGGFAEVLHMKFDSSKPFTDKDAKTVVNFIDRYELSPDLYYLIIHCNWGVHRSTAIGQFVEECYKLPVQAQYGLEDHIDDIRAKLVAAYKERHPDTESLEGIQPPKTYLRGGVIRF